MSSTVPVELTRIRRLICDRKVSDPVIPSSLLEELFYDAMDEIARECGAGDIVQTGFATVGPTSTTVAVSATYPAMRHLKQLVRATDGVPLEKTTYDLILRMRQFGGAEFGPPRVFTLVPGVDESVLLEVYPTPSTAMSLTGVWEPVPATVSQVTGTVYLSPTGLLALRTLVASRALASLSASALEKLGRSPQYVANLDRQARDSMLDEWSRMHAGEMQDRVVHLPGRRG
jgi:hypothetical protein